MQAIEERAANGRRRQAAGVRQQPLPVPPLKAQGACKIMLNPLARACGALGRRKPRGAKRAPFPWKGKKMIIGDARFAAGTGRGR